MFARKFSRRAVSIVSAAVAVLHVAAVVFMRAHRGPEIAQVPFSDLLRHVEGGQVAEVVVNGDALDFKLANGSAFRTVTPPNYVTANTSFVSELARKNIRIDVRTAPDQAAYSYGALVLGLVFLGVLGLTLYRVTTG